MQTHWRQRTKWVFPGGEWIKCPNKYSWVLHLRPRHNGKTWPRLGSPYKSTTNKTPNYLQTNMMRKPNSQRFNMTYTKREAPILVPIEHKLCSELGLDRSELHKTAIKEFWNRRQQSTLALIWVGYGEVSESQRCPLPDACRCREALADETRWPGEGTDPGDLRKQDQEEVVKGILKRYLDRTTRRTFDRSMEIYGQTLWWLSTIDICRRRFFNHCLPVIEM